MNSTPKFKQGDMVEILPSPVPSANAKYASVIGRICTITSPAWRGRNGFWRYYVDVESPHKKGEFLAPIESVLKLIKPGKPPLSTWDEFKKLTGVDPRKEPVTIGA